MFELKLLLVSESAAIDSRFNTLSAFHILEQINTPAFPLVVPHISVIIIWVREETDPTEHRFQFEVYSGTQQLLAQAVPVNFDHHLAARTVLEMHGLLVPSPNLLRFCITDERNTLGSWAVTLNQIGETQVQMNIPPPQLPHPAE